MKELTLENILNSPSDFDAEIALFKNGIIKDYKATLIEKLEGEKKFIRIKFNVAYRNKRWKSAFHYAGQIIQIKDDIQTIKDTL